MQRTGAHRARAGGRRQEPTCHRPGAPPLRIAAAGLVLPAGPSIRSPSKERSLRLPTYPGKDSGAPTAKIKAAMVSKM